jgi:hypothetical protein
VVGSVKRPTQAKVNEARHAAAHGAERGLPHETLTVLTLGALICDREGYFTHAKMLEAVEDPRLWDLACLIAKEAREGAVP